jgi:hypothetical protein
MKYHIYVVISSIISLYGLYLIYEENPTIAIGILLLMLPIFIAFTSHLVAIFDMIKSIVKII